MRLSADKSDPGFRPDCWKYEVVFDGEKVRECITADEEAGEALFFVKPLKHDGDGNLMTELRRGRVEIRLLELPDASAGPGPASSSREHDTHPLAAGKALRMTTETPETFQNRVQSWMLRCFGPEIAGDRAERNHRFLEEAIELVQACGCTRADAHQLVDYVFNRPVGEPVQGIGGVMVTLAALCLAGGMDMHGAGETELSRISAPDVIEKIRAKQATKPKASPLPQVVSAETAGAGAAWEGIDQIGVGRPVTLMAGHRVMDDVAVDDFALAMKSKLARMRAEGRGDGAWGPRSLLSQLLRDSVEAGDPLDVASFAMMLHQQGESIAPAPRLWQPIKDVPHSGPWLVRTPAGDIHVATRMTSIETGETAWVIARWASADDGTIGCALCDPVEFSDLPREGR